MSQRIEDIDIEDRKRLRAFPDNPKDHDIPELQEAMRKRGYATPGMIDDKSGYIVEGHGRLEALRLMKASGEDPPKRLKVVDGRWFMPFVRGVSFDTLEEARAHLLAANRVGEGMWVSKLLAKTLSKLGEDRLAGTGFDAKDIVHFAALAKGPVAPAAFPSVGENLPTDFCCPKCKYEWSGNPLAGKVKEEPVAEKPAKKKAAK